MENTRLLASLAADYARLREVAQQADLTAPVPSCPGWSMADLVQHVGLVYAHKVACMRASAHPDPWPAPGLVELPPRQLLDESYADLVAEFAARDPADKTFTWYALDQSVGFWIRRMAQESVIHRVDAELGAGVPVTPIPDDIALDGIDELLLIFVEWGSQAYIEELGDVLAGADGRAVRVQAGDRAWLVRPTPKGVEASRLSEDGTADATAQVVGEPQSVLLWLWNRGGDGEVATDGDAEQLAYLRRVLAACTG